MPGNELAEKDGARRLMLRCKQVSDALAAHRYWEMSWRQRLGMRLHVLLCAVCGRYNRQVMDLQDASREYTRFEEGLPDGLSDERKAKLRALLEQKR